MSPPRPATIDLNCDLGEGARHDAAVMPLVSSANIACGGHAGDKATMAATVALARRHGVAIGAHPGHADREHFGRRQLPITPEAAAALVVEQVARLAAVAGEPPYHVKLHGGLYHQVARDAALATAVADGLAARWPEMILVAPAGSRLVAVGRAQGLTVAEEAFLDRAYAADGSLVNRSEPGAVITDPRQAAGRAVRLAREGVVEASDGATLPLAADTLCIHGDGADPAGLAIAVREALKRAGIGVARFKKRVDNPPA
ncbi:MAG: 5-oxoprolinase subunit PxpA [Pirellulales bacterium]